jgi:DHA3 family macrolide efflux protein-like MFS transporter
MLGTSPTIVVNLLVTKEDLMRANSLTGIVFSTSMLVGPLLAGVALAIGGYMSVLIVNMCFYLIACVLGFTLHIEERRASHPFSRNFFREMREGMEVISKNRTLWGNMLFMVFFMMGGGIFASMTYIFVNTILGADASTYAWMMSLQGIGNLLGGFFIQPVSKRLSPPKATGLMMLLMFVFELAYLCVPSLLLMISLCPLVGVAQQIAMVTAGTMFQKNCPREYLGRVVGFRMTLTSLLSIVSTGVGAILLQWVGVRELLMGASMLLLCSSVCGYLFVRDEQVTIPSGGKTQWKA